MSSRTAELIDCDEDFVLTRISGPKACLCCESNKRVQTFRLCLEWKERCNFCKFRRTPDKLRALIESCKFTLYMHFRNIFTLDELLLSEKILKKMFLNDCQNIPLEDLAKIVCVYNRLGFSDAGLTNLSAPLNQDGKIVLKNMVMNLRLFSWRHNRSKLLTVVQKMCSLVSEEILEDDFPTTILIEYCLQVQLYDAVERLLRIAKPFHLYDSYYLTYGTVPHGVLDSLLPKLTNFFEIVSHERRSYYNHCYRQEFALRVDTTRLLPSLVDTLTSDTLSNLTKWYYETYIVYFDSASGATRDGIDANGLTKDFYSKFYADVGNLLLPFDGYLSVPSTPVNEHKWLIIGILMARGIINHALSPHLKLHPYLCYQILAYRGDGTLKEIFEALRVYNIEFFINLQKVMKMNQSEFSSFLVSMEEPPTSKKNYVFNVLEQTFTNPNSTMFINGFQSVFKEREICTHASFDMLYNFISRDVIYDIMSDSPGSLKSNLRVHSSKESSEKFKSAFLGALEYLNLHNQKRLQKFIQFWFGSESLVSFAMTQPPTVTHTASLTYCMSAHTCFNELEYNTFCFTTTGILSAIECTLINQELSTLAGQSMQLA